MKPITQEQQFKEFLIESLVKEQQETNKLLNQLIELQTQKPKGKKKGE
jgi:hypothetical protein